MWLFRRSSLHNWVEHWELENLFDAILLEYINVAHVIEFWSGDYQLAVFVMTNTTDVMDRSTVSTGL